MSWIEAVAGMLQPQARLNAILGSYWNAFDPTRLAWRT
jgi:hypothetical protein